MNKRTVRRWCWRVAVLWLLAGPALATNLLMVRSQLSFAEAEPRLELAIQDRGYVVSRVQRVDIDLVSMGFSQGTYRVVSYGKPDEIRRLAEEYPQLVPFLPLTVVIFAELNDTLVVAVNPLYYQRFFSDPELIETFRHWNDDLQLILEAVRDLPPS